MAKSLKKIMGRKIFVDTNAFIYFLTGICNNITKEIFTFSYLGKIKLITSTRVVDELLFKVMIIKGKEKYGLQNKALEKLKRDKEKIGSLSRECELALEFVEKAKTEIREVSFKDLKVIPGIMKEFGLFGNDAITIKIMRRFNLKYLLSSDSDFNDIDGIEVIDPLWET
ncbi:MAG: PIN domain-containing protein [Campylobacterota bacterium]|nr:PIN domain-containing protein [Campylobacterota bacterium]